MHPTKEDYSLLFIQTEFSAYFKIGVYPNPLHALYIDLMYM